jgi:hypothetical protein
MFVQALAGNADPSKADVVLTQAVESLRLSVASMADTYSEVDGELFSRLVYLRGRLEALEEFVGLLNVEYYSDYMEAFGVQPEAQGNGVGHNAEGSDHA